ncbi:hypothetical protein BH24ACT20_BH24ACT20_12360 [soil metagenome]
MADDTKPRSSRRPATYWLIVKKGAGNEDTLTLNLDGEEESGKSLPVFCFKDEADMFLSFGALGAGWQLKETTTGELASILLGPCAGIGFVSLDPLPELFYRGMIRLVSLRRKWFVYSLIGAAQAQSRGSLTVKEPEPLMS